MVDGKVRTAAVAAPAAPCATCCGEPAVSKTPDYRLLLLLLLLPLHACHAAPMCYTVCCQEWITALC